jgi:hypothetical protein
LGLRIHPNPARLSDYSWRFLAAAVKRLFGDLLVLEGVLTGEAVTVVTALALVTR